MNPVHSPSRAARGLLGLVALASLLLTAGCLEQVCIWSPDGRRAAVINPASRELLLCDADGRLLPPRLSDVSRAAWLGDSQRLVLARKRNETQWAALARAMPDDRAAALVGEAEAVWQKIQSGAAWSSIGGVKPLFAEREPTWNFVCLYLRDRYGDALRSRLSAAEWTEIAGKVAAIHELVVARIDGDRLVTGPQLYTGIDEVLELRVSPGDRAVAFVAESTLARPKENQLWLVPLDTRAPQLVADRVAWQPDWTADGRSLVYFQAASSAAGDDLRLGTLVQREVLDPAGTVHLDSEQRYLAGWVFSEQTRIRCLRDGRILFNAAEISLPIAAEDYGEQREQLFAFDAARQATLVRMIPRKQQDDLPKVLAFFEVSPDEQQALFGDLSGQVCVLTLATGAVEYIQPPAKKNLQGAPMWRKDGAFSYTRRTSQDNGHTPARAAEVVLRRGTSETVLSATWPDELVNALVSDRD